MCGIAGIYHKDGRPASLAVLKRMTDIIAHRGPDGEGHYTDGCAGLGHRRLAVIDLTPAGHQPIANEDGQVILSYNGEIYNFQELRLELESLGHRFHSRTDSEVVTHAYEEWGVECVERFNGMFAFALWDRRRQQMFLARDRFGIKPLYYGETDGTFIFASEIKAILEYPNYPRDICYEALNEYFTFQNIFTDLTLFRGIRLLQPGHWMLIKKGADSPRIHQYWDYNFAAKDDCTEDELVDRVRALFEQAVTRQLVSDVQVMSYLSGGMDSGSITAVAARNLPRLTTITGGFDLSSASGLELGCDERQAAEVMANLFKTEHYEVVMHAGDMEYVMPELIWHLEDLRVGQCYPNYYAARLASKFSKVVLSGAGGDELFGGYPWRYYRAVGSVNREDYYRRYYDFWQRLVGDGDKEAFFTPETYAHLKHHSAFDVFRSLFCEKDSPLEGPEDYVNKSLYFEAKTFLHGLFVVEDKLSSAHGLETRVPFLDNDLVDLAQSIPPRYKLRNLDRVVRMDENEPGKLARSYELTRDGKAILRRAMSSLIPAEIAERHKQGFTAPDASWFRGESIDYVKRLLLDKRARIYEHLQPGYVERRIGEHISGKVNHRLFIWSLLSFEWWLRTFKG